jgi:hypothetical protein
MMEAEVLPPDPDLLKEGPDLPHRDAGGAAGFAPARPDFLVRPRGVDLKLTRELADFASPKRGFATGIPPLAKWNIPADSTLIPGTYATKL